MKQLLIIALLFSNLAFSGGWKIEKFKDGIKVYTREHENSDIDEYRVMCTVNAPLATVESLLLDLNNLDKWMPDIMYSKEISKTSYFKRTVYYQVDVPWPVSNRDVCLDYNITKSANEVVIKMKDNQTAKKKNDDFVRMPECSGYWRLTKNGSKTNVVWQMLGDPGGSVPSWVINMFIVDTPYDTMVALRKKVK